MTPHLHVQVLLHGAVVEDRLVEVRDRVWLGECDGAAVAFLGGIVGVRAAGGELWHRGQRLEADEPVEQAWGPVTLRMTATLPERLPRDWSWVPDPMLFIGTVALLLAGAFADTVALQIEAGEVRARSEQRAGRVVAAEERYQRAPDAAVDAQETWPPPATFHPRAHHP